MKKQPIILIAGILILCFINPLSTICKNSESKKSSINTESHNFRYVPNIAYGFGEKLEYKVGYKFITAGTGYFHILPKPKYINGRKCYDVRFKVQSLKSLEWVYRVEDRYSTTLDVAGIFPWKFEQHIREGDYRRDFVAKFDQVNNKAITKDSTYDVPPYVHDIVSAFYYVRTLDLASMPKDTVFYLQNFFGDSTYTLGVRVLGRQTVDVEAGKFKCVVIEPLVVEGGLFQSEGRILIWMTEDERKIPVKVATKVVIGYVSAELVRYRGTRGPIEAKIK
jgi:hypothetical protein